MYPLFFSGVFKTKIKVCYQLSMMIFRVPKMKQELKSRIPNLSNNQISQIEKHIIKYCKSKKIYDLKKLVEIRALDNKKYIPTCPLCLEKLNAKSFFETASKLYMKATKN